MPRFGAIRRRELIAALRRLGFNGPYSGGKHERDKLVLTIPNPHRGEIGPKLVGLLLRQAGISREEWEKA